MKRGLCQLVSVGALVVASPLLLGQTASQPAPKSTAKHLDTLDAGRLLELVDQFELDAANASCSTMTTAPTVVFDEVFFDRCIDIARHLNPDLGERLAELRANNPRQFEQNLRTHGKTLVSLAQLAHVHPNLYELRLGLMKFDQQTNEVAAEFRRSLANPKRETLALLEPKLRAHVLVQVELSLRVREEQLCQLRDHLQRLENELDADRKRATQIVEQRFLDLLDRQSLQNYHAYKASTSPEDAAQIQQYMQRQRQAKRDTSSPE